MIFIVVLLIPCIAFSVISMTYSKYRDNKLKSKLSGFEIARKILDENNLKDMYIVEVKGNYNDHYDYKQKVIRLSTDIYHGDDVTAAAVASRVCSYAILDKDNNSFMRFSFTLNPFIVLDTYLAYILFIIGLCLQDFAIVDGAVLLLVIALVFYLVTLPVQFNAINKAREALNKLDKLEMSEKEESNSVLRFSAYVFIMSILTCITNLYNEIMYNMKKRG